MGLPSGKFMCCSECLTTAYVTFRIDLMDTYLCREEDNLDNGELMKAEIHPGEGEESPTEGSMVSSNGRFDCVNFYHI